MRILVNFNVLDVTTYGGSDGAVVATVGGNGTPPYTYAWSNGQSGVNVIGGVTTGTYMLTVTDAEGCVAVDVCCGLPVIIELLSPVDQAMVALTMLVVPIIWVD